MYADHYNFGQHVHDLVNSRTQRGQAPSRPMYVFRPSGQFHLRQDRAEHMPSQRSNARRPAEEQGANGKIERLAMELSAMGGANASLCQPPLIDWGRVT